jgi:hypothetical protein
MDQAKTNNTKQIDAEKEETPGITVIDAGDCLNTDWDCKTPKPGKRPPGRPRKKPIKEPMKRDGIKGTPINAENCMEMIYDTPSVFKRVFSFMKSMAVKNMQMVFDENQIELISTDHLINSSIKVTIFCSKINHYYCAKRISINVHPDTIEKIIKNLDKHYTSVAFILKTITCRSTLGIIFKNDSIKIDEYREIMLVKALDITVESFDVSEYPIKFVFPARYFKKFIGDIDSCSDKLTISKAGAGALVFSHVSMDKKMNGKYVVQDGGTIKLISTVSNDDIFSSSVHTHNIKPLSSSLLSDYVHIAAHSNKNIIFKVFVDRPGIAEDKRAIIVQINTKTVNKSKK